MRPTELILYFALPKDRERRKAEDSSHGIPVIESECLMGKHAKSWETGCYRNMAHRNHYDR
jgi:hypothetical protein